jgi:hypothetical protein
MFKASPQNRSQFMWRIRADVLCCLIFILGNTKKSGWGGGELWKGMNRLLCSQHFWYRQRCVITRTVVMEVPHSCSPHFRSFSSYLIIHTTQNFQTMSLSDRLAHWNELVMNNAAKTEKKKKKKSTFFFFPRFRSHLSRFSFWRGESVSIRFSIIPICRRVRLRSWAFSKEFGRHFVAGYLCKLKC